MWSLPMQVRSFYRSLLHEALRRTLADLLGKGNASTILEADPADLADTFRVNVLGPLVLFQNTQHLLRKSTPTGRFIIITSAQGAIAGMIPGPAGGYSGTKAAVKSLAVKIQEENQDLIAVSIWYVIILL